MASNRGQAYLYIDGVQQPNINDFAPTTRWQAVRTWTFSTPGDHTIEVKVQNGYIDLDAFIVDIASASAGTYDDTSSQPYYIGNWIHGSGWPNAYNGTTSWSKNTEDAVRITFTGTSIQYCYTKASNRGKVAITLDGIDLGLLDLYSSSTQWQQCNVYTPGYGVHTFHVSVSGQKNPASSDYYVDADKFVIFQ